MTLTRRVLAPPVHGVLQVQTSVVNRPGYVQAKYYAAPGATVTIEEDMGTFTEYWEYTQQPPVTVVFYTEVWNDGLPAPFFIM